MDPLIPARKSNPVIINKTCPPQNKTKQNNNNNNNNNNRNSLVDHSVKRKQKDIQIPGSCQRTKKKKLKHEDDSDTNSCLCTYNSLQRLEKGIGGIANQRKNLGHTDNSMDKIGKNIRKSP